MNSTISFVEDFGCTKNDVTSNSINFDGNIASYSIDFTNFAIRKQSLIQQKKRFWISKVNVDKIPSSKEDKRPAATVSFNFKVIS